MADQVVRVERIDKQVGPYRVSGTLTLLWNPEVAERVKASMVSYMLANAPQILARARAQAEAQNGSCRPSTQGDDNECSEKSGCCRCEL